MTATRYRDLLTKARIDVVKALTLTLQLTETKRDALGVILVALDEIKVGMEVLMDLPPEVVDQIASKRGAYGAALYILENKIGESR